MRRVTDLEAELAVAVQAAAAGGGSGVVSRLLQQMPAIPTKEDVLAGRWPPLVTLGRGEEGGGRPSRSVAPPGDSWKGGGGGRTS